MTDLERKIEEANAVVLTPEQEASIDVALANARDWYDWEIATAVRYVASEDIFIVVLRSGRRLVIPREDLQRVADASVGAAANVMLENFGSSLHWPELDEDFSVVGLYEGRLGNEHWMEHLAAKYGWLPVAVAS